MIDLNEDNMILSDFNKKKRVVFVKKNKEQIDFGGRKDMIQLESV